MSATRHACLLLRELTRATQSPVGAACQSLDEARLQPARPRETRGARRSGACPESSEERQSVRRR